MARRKKPSGLYERNGRFYLAWYVAGAGPQHAALIPAGEKRATKSIETARAMRQYVMESGLTAAQLAGMRMGLQNNKTGKPRSKAPKVELPEQVEQLLTDFEQRSLDHASKAQAQRNVAKVRDYFADRGITDAAMITAANIDAHLAAKKAVGLAPSTRAKSRVAVSGFCRFLAVRGILRYNPATAVRGPKIILPPPRFLSPEEHDKAIALATTAGVRVEVCTALWTGMRMSELRTLDWSAVDWDGRKIVLLKTKTNRPRAIPMKSELQALLEEYAQTLTERRRPARGLVFPDDDGGLRKVHWWARIALKPLKAGLPIFGQAKGTSAGWHLFRHSFCSRLVQAGVPLRTVAEWAGHTSIATTMRYCHLAPNYDAQIEKA